MKKDNSRSLTVFYFFLLAMQITLLSVTAGADDTIQSSRVASIYVSQDLINEQIAAHSKSELLKEMKVELDSSHGQIFLRGKIQVPVEELRAVNLDPKLGVFRFQVTIKLEATKEGYLILDFPLAETYFYPASSKNVPSERIVVPVQMISLALASARGYLAALSGDFSGFDRRTEKLTALIKALDHAIAHEKNADAKEELKNQRTALRLQMAAVPVERKQLQAVSKELEHVLGFTGEKELNLNEDLGARKNALIFKIKLAQLAPFLNGVELGGIRVLLDKKDGSGENYLAVDVNSKLEGASPHKKEPSGATRVGLKTAPSVIMRLNQALFESEAVVDAEKKDMSSKLKNIQFAFKDDGLHVSGAWHAFLFTIPFETTVSFVTTALDVFEVRVGELDVAGINFEFVSSYILDSMKKKLDRTLKGICSFKDVINPKTGARALQVTVAPKALVPAFPDLHLVSVDMREQEFLLKIGRP